jgi:hypothetical protein
MIENITSESEWLSFENVHLLLEFHRSTISWRKCRLFASACCRLIWHWITDERSRQAVELCELYGEGRIDQKQLETGFEPACIPCDQMHLEYEHVLARYQEQVYADQVQPLLRERDRLSAAADAACSCLHVASFEAAMWASIRTVQARSSWEFPSYGNDREVAALLKEITGNPFRKPHLDGDWLEWSHGVVPELARSIYEDCRFHDMPILGDALEEAGCVHEEILSHCRHGNLHVRGCWVLDLQLDKD